MSTLKERLHEDVVVHMKSGNRVALATVRNVLGEIATREKSGKAPVELDDAQTTALLQKEAAKRRDTARIYAEAGQAERAAAEIAEAEVIEAYLPGPLTEAEVEAIVDETVAELQAGGAELSMRRMGAVMKPVTAKVAGRFDGKAVSDIVRRRLAP
ncbi:GatB/YqeY domain-containing protein [Arthrobacter deserti]|uniref:GatB/YqeY domain-containing protein n=1 Tax=Arthrobacter deserti TaxID=1742687 RepID=A0ABX1JNX3_9MICC|nr:GatB/YqeY domain-containing protein [Arthrobacter deserti]